MAYDKQTWQTGDTVTSAKLNHMEDGIANAGGGGGALVVNVTASGDNPDLFVCDKTAGEMFAADIVVLFVNNTTKTFVINAAYIEGVGYVFTDANDNGYTAPTADDYPSCDMS